MRSIFKSVIILLSLFAVVLIANRSLQNKIIRNGLNLEKKDHILIFGDSHGACSFNPKYIPNAKNLSNYGESLIFSYYKLKRIIENNEDKSDLKVVLALSYHSIYQCRENYKDPEQRTEIIQDYYPLLDEEGLSIIGKYGMDYHLTKIKFDLGVPFRFKTTIQSLMSKKPAFITGYENSNISNDVNTKHANKKIHDHFRSESKPNPSPILLKYLKKISQLTKDHEIPLLIINTPKHDLYRSSSVPSNVPLDYTSTLDALAQNNPYFHFFDLSASITEKSYFRDTDHLNSLGAKLFSIQIDSILNTTPTNTTAPN